MSNGTKPRLPIQPLLAYARYTPGDPNADIASGSDVLAEQIGVTGRTFDRWIAEGSVPYAQADRVCMKLDLHPILVWPEWELELEDA